MSKPGYHGTWYQRSDSSQFSVRDNTEHDPTIGSGLEAFLRAFLRDSIRVGGGRRSIS